MTTLFRIGDERTMFCRKAMKAHGGVWNPVTKRVNVHERGRSLERDMRTLSDDASERGAARTLLAMVANGDECAA